MDRSRIGQLMLVRCSGALLLCCCCFLLCCSSATAQSTERFWFTFLGTMDLSPISESSDLDADAIATWESQTADFYVQALASRTDLSPSISDPQFSIELLFASRPGDGNDGTSILALQYEATASYIASTDATYDPGFLALPAFRNQDSVLDYIITLRGSDHAIFTNLMSLSLTVSAATSIPAPAPTSPPTVQATPSPTGSSTPEPTGLPTQAPVIESRPTFSLTAAPVDPPTPFPTLLPTLNPTTMPVVVPVPTLVPDDEDDEEDGGDTPAPSEMETTLEPTAEPGVASDTAEPTASPVLTTAPTNVVDGDDNDNGGDGDGDEGSATPLQTKYATTQLILQTVPSIMEDDVLQAWRQVTTSYLVDYIQALDSTLLEVSLPGDASAFTIEKVTQEPNTDEDGEGRRRALKMVMGNGGRYDDHSSRRQQLRALQQRRQQENVTVTTTVLFALMVEFVSKIELPPSYDADSLVNGAFATRSRRVAYRNWISRELQTLLSQGDVTPEVVQYFENLVDVVFVSDNNDDNQELVVGSGGDAGGVSLGAIIGGVVAGVVGLALAVIAFFKFGSNRQNSKDLTSSDGGSNQNALHYQYANSTKEMSPSTNGGGKSPPGSGRPSDAAVPGGIALTWEPAEQPSRLNQEIVVEDTDDVSTIGDPLFYGQHTGIQEDERTATASVVQSDTYNSLLGRRRGAPMLNHENSFARSQGDTTEFSAFTGMSKYLSNSGIGNSKRSLLGELGLNNDDTSFEQRLFPMDRPGPAGDEGNPSTIPEQDTIGESEERSLDYSLPTALM